MRRSLLLLLGFGVLAACSRSRPIHAAAALPAPGQPVPPFVFTDARGVADSVRSAALRGTPTILALWSIHCPFQGPAMADLARLAGKYRPAGVRVIVLADDAPGPALHHALDTLPWTRVVDRVGSAGGRLAAHFDRAADAPERAQYRVEFVLPSFLLIDGEGRVVRRAFGPAGEHFRPALDSLLALPARGAT